MTTSTDVASLRQAATHRRSQSPRLKEMIKTGTGPRIMGEAPRHGAECSSFDGLREDLGSAKPPRGRMRPRDLDELGEEFVRGLVLHEMMGQKTCRFVAVHSAQPTRAQMLDDALQYRFRVVP